MKRKTAKEILAESFRELAAKKKIDKITIQDITDNCGYSTATFYRQFNDKYDLIAWEYAQRISQIMMRVGEDGYTWEQTLIDGLNQYQKEREYLANILIHSGGHDSFVRYMSDTHYKELSGYIKQLNGAYLLVKQTDLRLRLFCLGTASINCEWILGKVDATAQELTDIYKQSLPEALKQILLKR